MTRWCLIQQELYIEQKESYITNQENCEYETLITWDMRWGSIVHLNISHMSYIDNIELREMND